MKNPLSRLTGGAMFGIQEMLPFLVLALGAALVVGNVAALVRPPEKRHSEGDLDQAPLGRSLLMAAVGLVASIWAIASLLS